MNFNMLKIIERLGYTVQDENNNIRIYDKNYKELRKIPKKDEVYRGIDFISENGQVIHIDDNGFLEIKVDDNFSILADNIYNKHTDYPIILYFGGNMNRYQYKLSVEILGHNSFMDNDFIFVDMANNPDSKDKLKFDSGNLNIEVNENGAIVSVINGMYDSLRVDECTTSNYLKLIVAFINKLSENNPYEKRMQDGFNLIAPIFTNMIDELINRRNIKRSLGNR